MHNSQLISVLKTLSKKECREFKKWIRSPFHNQREDVIQLFEYLAKQNNLEKESALSKAKIYNKIFPREAYDDAKIRQTMYFLQKQIDDFLTYQELSTDEVGYKTALLRAYRKKQLEKLPQKTIKTIEAIQANYPYRDFTYLWNQYLFQQEVYLFSSEKRGKRAVQFNLQEVVDALDKAYFGIKIKQSCLMLAHKSVFKVDYNEGPINEVIKFLKDHPDLLSIPAIAAYYYAYMTYQEAENENFFYELKKVIRQSLHLFPKNEARDILLIAIGYCNKKLNQAPNFIRESFDLYKYGIESEILLQNNTITRWGFMNIVRLGSNLTEEFEWVSHFIDKYQNYLDSKDKENVVHFCKAKLSYAKGDFDNSMVEFAKVKENDILLNLSAKHTLLKIYYEKDEFEILESLLDSMGKYLRRKDVPSNYRNAYDGIIKLTKRLVRLNPFDSNHVNKFKSEIQTASNLPSSDREWLLKQVAAL